MSDSNEIPPKIDEEKLIVIRKMYASRELYWPHYTWLAQTSYLGLIESEKAELTMRGFDLFLLQRNLSSVFDKINGSFYHLQRLKETEQIITELGKEVVGDDGLKIPKGVMGTFGVSYEPIGYEYEALLVTLRSALDILAITLSSIIEPKSDNILRFSEQICKESRQQGFKAKLKKYFYISENQRVLSQFKGDKGTKSRRNYAVHAGSLSTGTINIQFRAGSLETRIIKSKAMPVMVTDKPIFLEEDLDSYCSKLFYDTCDMLIGGIELILGDKLPRGKKDSVFEVKHKQV